jgi:hypothetical protein
MTCGGWEVRNWFSRKRRRQERIEIRDFGGFGLVIILRFLPAPTALVVHVLSLGLLRSHWLLAQLLSFLSLNHDQ